jgi:hypothetical protein
MAQPLQSSIGSQVFDLLETVLNVLAGNAKRQLPKRYLTSRNSHNSWWFNDCAGLAAWANHEFCASDLRRLRLQLLGERQQGLSRIAVLGVARLAANLDRTRGLSD